MWVIFKGNLLGYIGSCLVFGEGGEDGEDGEDGGHGLFWCHDLFVLILLY